jgi:hypothetical protein
MVTEESALAATPPNQRFGLNAPLAPSRPTGSAAQIEIIAYCDPGRKDSIAWIADITEDAGR